MSRVLSRDATSLQESLKLPRDRNLLQALEQCVRRLLMTEKDVDVAAAVASAVERLDKTHVHMESVR